jgi:ABC-type transport system substrate-binding protein
MGNLTTKATVALASALLLGAGLAGCGSAAANGSSGAKSVALFSTKPTYGGTLTIAWVNDTATLDPAYWDDAQSLVTMQAIYDTLVDGVEEWLNLHVLSSKRPVCQR